MTSAPTAAIFACASASFRVSGWKTSMPCSSATFLTATAAGHAAPGRAIRLGQHQGHLVAGGDDGRSACAANSGVPAKISFMP
jgi:hypothetical protein